MKSNKNKFLIGSIILLISSVLAKFFGMIYKVPLLKILKTSGLGIYQMIYPIFSLFVILSSSGIVVALSKNISRERINHCKQKVRMYLKSAFVLILISCIIFTILFAVLSPIVALKQGDINLSLCYFAILPCIILSGLCAVYRGYFLGQNLISITGIAVVLEQIAKLLFSLFFANLFFQKGSIFAVFGAMIGITIAEALILIFYFVCYKSKSKKETKFVKLVKSNISITKTNLSFNLPARKISFKSAFKKNFGISFFVTIEAVILPLLSALDGIFVVPILINNGFNSQTAYLIYGISSGIISSIISLPVIFSNSVGSAIIPNLQSSVQENSKNVFFAIKVVWLLSVLTISIFLILPNEIITFLFSGGLSTKIVDEFSISADILKISCFGGLYLCMLTLSTSILQGLGRSIVPARNLAICAIFRLFALFVLIRYAGMSIYALQFVDVCFYGITFLLNVIEIKKLVDIKFSIKDIFLAPLLSILAMSLAVFAVKDTFKNLFSPKLELLIVGFVSGTIYLVCLFATKTLKFTEVKTLLFSNKSKQNHSLTHDK